MSQKATTAVWEESKAKGPDLLVLLAIADAANSDGRNAFPGLPRLMAYVRKSRAAVLESIRRNIERGELRRTSGGHRGQLAVYEIVLPSLATYDDETEGPENKTQTPANRVVVLGAKGPDKKRKGSRDATSAPLLELHEQEQPARAFETFWKAYPERHGRKLAKGEASRYWAKLTAADQAAALVAVRHYAQACAKAETLAKDAFRWLRDRSFEDWITPAKGSRAAPPVDAPRCAHGFAISEDDDGWFAGCAECDHVALERAAADWRRERAQ